MRQIHMTKSMIVNFCGAPGVGKTILAEKLAQETGFYFIQRETILDVFFGNERDTPRYNAMSGPISKLVYEAAAINAKFGVSSITESPLKPAIQGQKAGFIDTMLEAAKKDDFNVALIYCTAPADAVWDYLHARGSPRDEQKYDLANTETGWPWFLKTFIDVAGPTQYEHLRVDTQLPADVNVGKIVEYLKR